MAERCASCHGGIAPAGGYDLTSYLGALGGGDDAIPDAIAGDPDSRILTELADGAPPHDGLADVVPLLRTWVVDEALAYFDSPLHPPGLLDPANGDFHAAELRRRSWDFPLCSGCHSDVPADQDFAGGAADRSCRTCHEDGPTACTTCHDQSTGAHPAHLVAGDLDVAFACADCHVVPERWDSPGHILRDGAVDWAPAEVTLGALANRDVTPPRRTEPAAYDPDTRTCSGVYCHGGILGDAAAETPAPVWTATGDQAACGGCHGVPPANHESGTAACVICHAASVDSGGAVIAAAHLDGTISVGDGSSECSGCHGDATSPAPPRALDGATETSVLSVGAHRGHLARSFLRGPIPCNECHVVPAEVDSPGHLGGDLVAEVFAPGSGVLARDDGATPVWDRTAGTCSGVYCHGPATPRWTALAQGEAACGTCHGIPPATAAHVPTLTINDCHTCHTASIDAFGNILFTGDNSQHLDGDVDF